MPRHRNEKDRSRSKKARPREETPKHSKKDSTGYLARALMWFCWGIDQKELDIRAAAREERMRRARRERENRANSNSRGGTVPVPAETKGKGKAKDKDKSGGKDDVNTARPSSQTRRHDGSSHHGHHRVHHDRSNDKVKSTDKYKDNDGSESRGSHHDSDNDDNRKSHGSRHERRHGKHHSKGNGKKKVRALDPLQDEGSDSSDECLRPIRKGSSSDSKGRVPAPSKGEANNKMKGDAPINALRYLTKDVSNEDLRKSVYSALQDSPREAVSDVS
ncbi:Fc.00g100480.m01.CDS01 [Cosmosporella sp. VM-42]